MGRVYLDNAATRKTKGPVLKKMEEANEIFWGNPSSQYSSGREAKRALEDSRAYLAKSINCDKDSLIFTSGATEANNSVIKSMARKRVKRGRHLITSMAEHPSVYESFKDLEKEGFEVTYLPLDETGSIRLKDLEGAIRDDTSLISIMYANNETGRLMPIEEIGDLIEGKDIFFHSDIVQAYGKKNIDVEKLGLDSVSTSAHKLAGPRGIGFLYIREGQKFSPYLNGGHQENDKRAGTENLPAIMGFAQAYKLEEEDRKDNEKKYYSLSSYLFKVLEEEGIEFERNGGYDILDNIVNLYLPGKKSKSLLVKLDLLGIEVSAGSACSAGSTEPSRILRSMFGEGDRIEESIRISFSEENTFSDIDALVRALK